MLDNLRPHQARALSLLRQSIGTGHRRPMVQAPTGAGKTVLAAAIVDGARRKHKKVLFVVPALSLIEQTVEAFYGEGLTEVGVIQAAHRLTDWSQPVQVASVQALMRRRVPAADLAIIDEAHRLFDFYGRWFADPEWQVTPIIGLSATPWTRGLGKLYDDLIVAGTTAELIKGGYLCPFHVYAPSHPDLTGVRTVAGDFEERGLSMAMNKAPLIADVVQTWRERAKDRPTLCFAVDRAHAKRLHMEFEAAGVPGAYIDAYTSVTERQEIERRLHAGQVKIVCNVGCLTTGVDWDVRCVILARPTKSEILFVQMIGRGLRTAQGKDDCIILDHSDTHLRLGFASDIHHEQLDDGRERQSKKAREAASGSAGVPQVFVLEAGKGACVPELRLQTGAPARDRGRGGRTRRDRGLEMARLTVAEKQSWYSQLLHIERARGYKRGWAGNQYRQKFGSWPRNLSEVAAEPTGEVENYIKSRLIAFAKRRAAYPERLHSDFLGPLVTEMRPQEVI